MEWTGVLVQAVLIVLVVYYVSRTTLFYQEKRFEVSGRLRNKGYITSGIMGAVFGAGWTPCTGPNLMVILALAGSAGSAMLGTALLTTYALGLGLPFLMVGLAFGAATTFMRRLMPYMTVIKAVNTALLLFMAALILSGRLQSLANLEGFDLGIFGEL
jgi:cytochrome c-type biogenesis protein